MQYGYNATALNFTADLDHDFMILSALFNGTGDA
jgi:hypothetical protein